MYYKLTCLLFLFTLSVSAQENYSSQSLKNIFDRLPLECKKRLIELKVCDCLLNGSIYRLDCAIEGNVIIHAGLKVFDDSLKKSLNIYIYSFFERELLKFILDDNQTREARRKEDQVYLFYANTFQDRKILNSSDQIRNVISEIGNISIRQDSLKCNVLLTNSLGEKLGMEFPVINTLISGMDKKELDENIFRELSKDIKTNPPREQKNFDNFFNSEGDLLVGEGERFLIKDFSSSRYYIREKDGVKLVYDKKYVIESLSNLLLTGSSANNPAFIDLKIKSYGNDDKLKSMTIDKLLSHFDDQFKLYFGIEDTIKVHLRGTLLLYNPSLNYLHLIDIKTDTGSMFRNPVRVTGTFYPYIPTHNIKDLFGKNNNEKSILLDDILNGNTYE